MGLTSYFRKFIENFALIAHALTNLTRKYQTWKWDKEEDQAFVTLINELAKQLVLVLYKQTAETELHTDASQKGLGGILMQKQDNGTFQPVSYFNKRITKEEHRYHCNEQIIAVLYVTRS